MSVNELVVRTDANLHTELVVVHGDDLVTTTLAIAAGTANSHEAVIKLARTYRQDLAEFGLVRFEIQPKPVGQRGGSDTEYAILNEHQATLLITYMRNGEIVRQFKRKLVRKFYDMRTELRAAGADPLAGLPAEQRVLVSLMVEQAAIKNTQVQLASAQAEQQACIQRIEARQSAIENGAQFFTVIGYGTYRGIKFDLTEAAALGRKASALSKANKITVDKVRDPRFGVVNSYHETMLDQALAALHGGM